MKNSAFENFSESALEALDFARCQRADGSYYGTGGQCRLGTNAGTKQEDGAKPQSGSTRMTSATPKGSMNKADRVRAEKAAAGRKVAAEMKPKVKELDRRAKDLNKEANRLEKAFRAQQKVVQKSPTKENKARLKLIQQETRMADRAAKQADRAADKASAQMEKALRKAMR